MNEAFRDWVTTVENTHYCIGSVGGPHPFPMMVRDFQRVIGVEARQQVLDLAGRLPDAVVACVGGGCNAIGVFHAFIPDAAVRLIGCEAGGDGDGRPERTAATLTLGTPGVLHGMRTYVLQDDEGQTLDTHSISAGLDYPGVGPEHAWLKDTGRAEYRIGHRRRGDGGVRGAVPDRGDHPRARVLARGRRRDAARPRARPGRADPGQPVRPRRQGRGHRVRLLRRVRMNRT